MTSLSEKAASLLIASKQRLALAESFTGGGITSALVEQAGISAVLIEGLVTYSNQSKVSRLGVSEKTLSQYGAVSEQTVLEMARGLLKCTKCDIALATSGNAGPTAEEGSEVGQYYVAIVSQSAEMVIKRQERDKSRIEVIQSGITTALEEIIKFIKNNQGEK